MQCIVYDMHSGPAEGLVQPSKEGLYTDTVMLKWCTPKSTAIGLSSFDACSMLLSTNQLNIIASRCKLC